MEAQKSWGRQPGKATARATAAWGRRAAPSLGRPKGGVAATFAARFFPLFMKKLLCGLLALGLAACGGAAPAPPADQLAANDFESLDGWLNGGTLTGAPTSYRWRSTRCRPQCCSRFASTH